MNDVSIVLQIAYLDADTVELVVDAYRRQSVVYKAASAQEYMDMMNSVIECARLLIAYDYCHAVETTIDAQTARAALQSYYARNRSLIASHTVRVWGDRK